MTLLILSFIPLSKHKMLESRAVLRESENGESIRFLSFMMSLTVQSYKGIVMRYAFTTTRSTNRREG